MIILGNWPVREKCLSIADGQVIMFIGTHIDSIVILFYCSVRCQEQI